MKRRLVAAVAALLLAGSGAMLLLGYVSRADQRAMAGMETVTVLVVAAAIPEGTPAEALGERVSARTLPSKAVAVGSLSGLAEVKGWVTTHELQPGEQLLASRFVDPATLGDPNKIKIPGDMHEVAFLLDRQRMLGGTLIPGAKVGVYVSLPKDDANPPQTKLVLHKVLVTKIGEASSAAPVEAEATESAPPAETVLVTLAATALNTEKLVFGAEHGTLWLSLEPATAGNESVPVITPENVYR